MGSKKKKNNTKSVKDAEGKKKGSRNRKIKKANKKGGKGGNTNKSKKKRKHIKKKKKVKKGKKGRKTGTKSKKGKKGKQFNNRKSKKTKKAKSIKNKKKDSGKRNKSGKGKKKTSGRRNKKNRKNKEKILKRLNKMKKNKGKRRKVTDSRQDSCQTLECLNDLVQTLKVEKDTVRNFLAQEKRVQSKIKLMQSKQSKKGDRWETAMFLEKRLGETKDHKAGGNGPLCKGVYNSTDAIAASDLAHNLEDCNKTIEEACKSHTAVNETELAQMIVCSAKMQAYKAESELCQSNPSNCTCWLDLNTKIPDIQDCNKASGSAKNAEKLLSKDYKACKQEFIKCSKYEDDAIEYMIQCYTSQTQIKANIKELLVIKDAATKLKTNQEAIVSTSDSKNSAKAAGKHNREKRQKNSVSVTCSTYIEEVETVDKVFTQTNLIGTQATIV